VFFGAVSHNQIMDNGTSITKSDLNAAITAAVKELKEYVDERTHDAETRLLRAFADYQDAQTVRYRHMKADLGNLNTASDERLAALEKRVSDVDKRLIAKGI